jgi:hypothetical protein
LPLCRRRDSGAELVADLARYVAALAVGGDLAAARIASTAIAELLRDTSADAALVLDLDTGRARRTCA